MHGLEHKNRRYKPIFLNSLKSSDLTLDLIDFQLPWKVGSSLTIRSFVKQILLGKARLCVCGAKNLRV